MRIQTDKKHFTKAERKFARLLQESHIPFKTKVKVAGMEVDFIIGKYAIELDGHEQSSSKNEMLFREGYVPIHFHNKEVNRLTKKTLQKLLR